jgi:hypothetical protein
MKLCKICQRHEVPAGRREYCGRPKCLRAARMRWKRELKKKSKELGTSLSDSWRKTDKGRAYHRNYMRAYRQKKHLRRTNDTRLTMNITRRIDGLGQ